MAEALAFYRRTLEFTLDSGGDGESNSSLTRGEAHMMVETAADHYGDEYNAAIRERLGTPSCIALYMEAPDSPRSTPGWKRPVRGSSIRSRHGRGVRWSSQWRITRATG